MRKTEYNVTVYFAHGIDFTFYNISRELLDKFIEWRDKKGEHVKDIFSFAYEGNIYSLNRDYLCAMKIEEEGNVYIGMGVKFVPSSRSMQEATGVEPYTKSEK